MLWRCSLLGADDGNTPHGAGPSRASDSLAAPDVFRTASQGQLLGVAAGRRGHFAAFCFGFFVFF